MALLCSLCLFLRIRLIISIIPILHLQLIPKIIARVIISNVQFQLQQVSQMRAFMQARDSQVKELEKAQRERVKALDDKRRAISPTRRQSALFAKGAQELVRSVQCICSCRLHVCSLLLLAWLLVCYSSYHSFFYFLSFLNLRFSQNQNCLSKHALVFELHIFMRYVMFLCITALLLVG